MKIIKINSCKECPFYIIDWCRKKNQIFIDTIMPIPKWCPLENERTKFEQLFCGRGTGKL